MQFTQISVSLKFKFQSFSFICLDSINIIGGPWGHGRARAPKFYRIQWGMHVLSTKFDGMQNWNTVLA